MLGKGAKPPDGSVTGSGGRKRTKRTSSGCACGCLSAVSGLAGRSPGKMAKASLPSKLRRADGLARQRIADDAGELLAVSLGDAFARRADGGERERLHLSACIMRASHRVVGEQSEDRLKPVMARVMEMIGLGRGEHDAVDARREQARPQAVRSGPEAVEDLGHGAFEVGDRRLAAVQRGEHVDQHDLPVEPREMIAEERPHHVGLIGLVAPLHHGEERAARETLLALRIERREGERGRAFEIARHEEASRRQRR